MNFLNDWYKLHSNPDLVLEYPNKTFEWKLTPFTEANLKVFILPENELNVHLKNQLRIPLSKKYGTTEDLIKIGRHIGYYLKTATPYQKKFIGS